MKSDSTKPILWSFCDCTAQSYFEHVYHQSICSQPLWCLRLCAHLNLPGAGALRSKIFSGYDILSANISCTKTDLHSRLTRFCKDSRQPFLPTCPWSSGNTTKRDEVCEDVTTAGAHPQDKCTPDYLRTQEQSEQARPEIHLAPFPADGSLPTSWGSLSASAPQTSSTTPHAQGEQAPASLPLNQTTGISSRSIPSISCLCPTTPLPQGTRQGTPACCPALRADSTTH